MSKETKSPNFFLVGAAKSGTSSFAAYLEKHPEIFICPEKECHFFSNFMYTKPNARPWDEYIKAKRVKNYDDYLSRHFYNVSKELIIGDASTDYLYHHEASIANIKHQIGEDVKILIILRNPVKASFSRYKHSVRRGWEEQPFLEAISSWETRKQNGYIWDFDYLNAFRYSSQVEAYLNAFDNVKVIILEEFIKDKEDTYRDVLKFLGVDPDFIPDNIYEKYNSSINTELPRWLKYLSRAETKRKLQKVLPKKLYTRVESWFVKKTSQKTLHVPSIEPHDQLVMKNKFKGDITKLEKLLGKNIPDWH